MKSTVLEGFTFVTALVACRAAVISRAKVEQPLAPAPAAALECYTVSFEIEDINYFQLSTEICPEKVQTVNAPRGNSQGDSGQSDGRDEHEITIDHAVDHVHDHAEEIVDQAAKAFEMELPWVKSDGEEGNLLQVDKYSHKRVQKCPTMNALLREGIQKTVTEVLDSLLLQGHVATIHAGAPGPAASFAPTPAAIVPLPPQVQGFLQNRGLALAPAPAAAQGHKPDVGIFVAFSPGAPCCNGGRAVKVDISFTDKPNNKMHDVLSIIPAINHGINTGVFHKELREAIEEALGINTRLGHIKAATKTIEQWPIHLCETHIQEIVQNFTSHYTREQVPRALYNECTNFLTKFSFSHDYVLDEMDTARCKKATVKLTKKWDYGENAEATDFEEMCLYACEAKYGSGAPTCNIAKGDHMLEQPA
jgi:hypothetical protein|mmetsp:Transcript_102696/g.162357  ORF Transcript_102696/g.162357 Transcript_102696/m.162357 type:complete len:420 (-) Transcript_102696:66-1325(-)